MAEAESYPPISDYALIGDLHSCALVSKAGSIDWCCLPRFDSPSVFGRVLDWARGGYFQVAAEGTRSVRRHYLPDTKILETTIETESGVATLTDFMPTHNHADPETPFEFGARQYIARILNCVEGQVRFSLICRPRFDYGSIAPHTLLQGDHCGIAHGGAQGIWLYCSAPLELREEGFEAHGRLSAGESLYASMAYEARFLPQTREINKRTFSRWLTQTKRYWEEWAQGCTYQGDDRSEVLRSALTLKALTYAPSGALLAAATTSLPEQIGGSLNWDYRFSWLRDATFALYGLFLLGYTSEARAFQRWMEWSTAGRARDLQLMYGLGGERRLTEVELPELEGYRGSWPVRIGNVAQTQFQLDIYGDVLDSAYLFHKYSGELRESHWASLQRVVAFVMDHWREPDEGIWESRDGRAHHVFSKAMCWVALDRAIKLSGALALPGDVARWQAVGEEIRDDILANGVDAERGVFVGAYGSKALDASTLLLPLVGFISADDPRMRATIEAIERELTAPNGLVYRNLMHGPKGSEGTFAICSFWLADNLIFLGEVERARSLFNFVKGFANDVGLFSEEIQPESGEMLGNFPQALTHLGHISTAVNLHKAESGSGRASD